MKKCLQHNIIFLLLNVSFLVLVNCECHKSKTSLKCANIFEASRHWNLDNNHRNEIKTFEIGAPASSVNLSEMSKLTSFSLEDSPVLEDLRIYGSLNDIQMNIFQKFTNLHYLLLNKNVLQRLKRGTFNDLKLVSLDLQDNDIQFIHPGTFRNSVVNQLYLDYNKLSTLVPHQLPEVEVLSLSHNELTFIENGTLSQKLKILDLTDNLFDDVLYTGVHGLVDLNTLILARNQLEVLNSFPDLPSLETLSLFKNRLNFINPDVLKKLPQLKTLNLCSNRLKKMPALHLIPALTNLYISNNLLQFIDFEPYRNLASVSIYGNPFTCRCLDMIEAQLVSKKVERQECDMYSNGKMPNCFRFAYNCKEVLASDLKLEQITELDNYVIMVEMQNSSCINFEEEHNYYKRIIPK